MARKITAERVRNSFTLYDRRGSFVWIDLRVYPLLLRYRHGPDAVQSLVSNLDRVLYQAAGFTRAGLTARDIEFAEVIDRELRSGPFLGLSESVECV